MYSSSEIDRPGSQPTGAEAPGASGPIGSPGKAFTMGAGPVGGGSGGGLENAFTLYLNNVGHGNASWDDAKTGLWYKVSTKGRDKDYVATITAYNGNPAKGGKAVAGQTAEYKVTKTSINKYKDRLTVDKRTAAGNWTEDTALTKTVSSGLIPSNFNKFRKEDPVMFKKFMHAMILHLTLSIMNDMKKQQAKMKKAMRGSL